MEEDKTEEIFNSALYQASNVVVGCDMAINSLLKRKYRELFNQDASRMEFKELLTKLKEKLEIPYEKEIRRIRAIRNDYSHEYRQINPDDIKFSIEVAKKFINEFKNAKI